jgi:D-glycero-D-manno-heptose 1,7-bisphosphate phosphatase
MKRPAVFFDRDNTLIVCDGYLGEPGKVQLVIGAAEAVARLRSLGFATIVFSNQSGVARGIFDESAVQAVNARLDELLLKGNRQAVIDRHEYCPFHPEGTVEKYRRESELRKPRAGMIHRSHQALDLNLRQSWVIGDLPRDIEAGRAAGCRTILFQEPSLKPSITTEAKSSVRAEYTCTSLKEAVDYIEHSLREEAKRPSPQPSSGASGEGDTGRPSPLPSPGVPGEAEREERDDAAGVAPTEIPRGQDTRLTELAEQMLVELKRRNEREHADFSVSKLLAGIVQVIVLAVLFVAYLNYQTATTVQSLLLLATVLQLLVATLLIMGRSM